MGEGCHLLDIEVDGILSLASYIAYSDHQAEDGFEESDLGWVVAAFVVAAAVAVSFSSTCAVHYTEVIVD